MATIHHTHGGQGSGALEVGLPLFLLAVMVIGYLVLAFARSTEPRGWKPWRTAAFVAGAVLLLSTPAEGFERVVPLLLGFASLAILLPVREADAPRPEFLRWHNEHVFQG